MELLPALVSTYGLAFFSFWGAIPAGLALGLSPLAVIAVTTLSYATGAALIALAGGRLRAWLLRRLGDRAAPDPSSRLYQVWQRYGVIGLGLLAPMTVGAQIGAAIGLALGAPPRRLTLVMAGCALVWSSGLTMAVHLGIGAFTGG